MKRITGLVFPGCWVQQARTDFLNHSRKYGRSIHPDSDTLKYAPDDTPTDSSLCIRHRVKVVHHFLIHGQELRLCILCLIHHLFHEHFLPSLSQGQMLSHHCSTFFGLTLQLSLVMSWPSWSVRAVAGMAGKSCDFLSRSFRQLHVNPSCQSLSYLPRVSGFCWPLSLR